MEFIHKKDGVSRKNKAGSIEAIIRTVENVLGRLISDFIWNV